MPLFRRVNDVQNSDWREIPIGVHRFYVSAPPEVRFYEQWNGYRARFALTLTPDNQKRVLEEIGQPPAGMQQSSITSYLTGLSLGYMGNKDHQYHSTKLSDFLAACVGQANMKRFIDWLIEGGGPPKADDPEDPDQEIAQYRSFLGWFEGLEVYGSIRHEQDAADKNKIWARFGGPMAIGSLPGQKEEAYQAVGLGKLRSMISEYEASLQLQPVVRPARPASTATADRPAQQFTADGKELPESPLLMKMPWSHAEVLTMDEPAPTVTLLQADEWVRPKIEWGPKPVELLAALQPAPAAPVELEKTPSLQWTTESPTLPGLYWWRPLPSARFGFEHRVAALQLVVQFGVGLSTLMYRKGTPAWDRVTAFAWEWAGPISVPPDVDLEQWWRLQ